jgi:hypothetical protein
MNIISKHAEPGPRVDHDVDALQEELVAVLDRGQRHRADAGYVNSTSVTSATALRRTTQRDAGALRSNAGRPSWRLHAVVQMETIGSRLERDRLLDRAQRIQRVLAALEDRAVYRDAVDGRVPAPLQAAIADFRIELRRLKQRLAELST